MESGPFTPTSAVQPSTGEVVRLTPGTVGLLASAQWVVDTDQEG